MSRAEPAVRLALFGTVVALAAGAGVLAASPATSPDLTFGEPLAHYGAQKAKVRKLPTGAQIAVGSRTGHDITVQWRDPHGQTWSAPQVVQKEAKLWTHDISVRQKSGTVAIAPDFWTQRVLNDDYDPSFTSLVVCRDLQCAESRSSGWLTGATIAKDGSLVAFQTDDDHVLLWEDGRGYRTSVVNGLPKVERRVRMMPDGSFVGVAGRWDGKQCHYVLYAAGRGSTAFRKEVETPGVADERSCLFSSVDVSGSNRVSVWLESLSDDVAFVRRGSTWSVDARALTRMQIPETGGKSTIATMSVGVGKNSTAVLGSRDRTTILLQIRSGYLKAWSKPRVIARAPTGTLCRYASPGETDGKKHLAMVLVHCYRAGRVVKEYESSTPDVSIVLATANGRRWIQDTVERTRWEPVFGRRALMAVGAEGSLLYRGGNTFEPVKLPVDTQWDGIALTHDGTRLVRIPGNGNPSAQCAPTWTLAPITARVWPAPTPFVAQGFPHTGTCSGGIDPLTKTTFMASLNTSEWQEWQGELELKDGRLEVAPPLE